MYTTMLKASQNKNVAVRRVMKSFIIV